MCCVGGAGDHPPIAAGHAAEGTVLQAQEREKSEERTLGHLPGSDEHASVDESLRTARPEPLDSQRKRLGLASAPRYDKTRHTFSTLSLSPSSLSLPFSAREVT